MLTWTDVYVISVYPACFPVNYTNLDSLQVEYILVILVSLFEAVSQFPSIPLRQELTLWECSV